MVTFIDKLNETGRVWKQKLGLKGNTQPGDMIKAAREKNNPRVIPKAKKTK